MVRSLPELRGCPEDRSRWLRFVGSVSPTKLASLLRMAAIVELVEVDVSRIHAGLPDDLLRRIDHGRRPAHVNVMVVDALAENFGHVLGDEPASAPPVGTIVLVGEHRDELESAAPALLEALHIIEAVQVFLAPRAE